MMKCKNIKDIRNDLDNGFLNQRLSDLERNFELQEEAKRLNDKNKIVKIKDMYKQLIESNNPEQKEKQFISIWLFRRNKMGDKFEIELKNGKKEEATLITRINAENAKNEYI